jgi:hypothetical protein
MAGPGDGAGTPAQYNPKELSVDKIQSPRDPATGQASGYLKIEGIDGESKVNATPGANGQFLGGGGGDGTGIRRDQPQTGNAARTETVGANESVNASPGVAPYREGGANDTTHRTKQPRRNRDGRRGKRMHKP